MSDFEDSRITYTNIFSPFEHLSNIGSSRVDGLPMVPQDPYVQSALQASPSPDYVLGPEHLPSPIYEQTLPTAASPTTELPGPVDHPADEGDEGDDEDESFDDEKDDNVYIEGDEEEGEHLAPADSTVVALPSVDHATSVEEIGPFKTDESAASPPPHPTYRVTARMPPGDSRPGYRFIAILDDEIMQDLERDVGYGITNSWDEIAETMQGAPATDETEFGRRVTDLVETMRRTPPLLPIPLSTPSQPLLPPSTDPRVDVRAVCLPPQKRLCYTVGLRFEKMAPKRTTGANLATTTNTTTTTVTDAQLKALIEQGINAALASRDVDRNTNGDDNHVSRTGVRRIERVTRECTYPDFMKCQPPNCKGTEGVIELTQWFKKMETVFRISNCSVENQIKFSTCTLLGSALTWWNSHVMTVKVKVCAGEGGLRSWEWCGGGGVEGSGGKGTGGKTRKKVIITEATIREALRLDDAESIDCLPNGEIFTELSRMGMSWNEFSSSMASAVICLSIGAASVDVDVVPAGADEPSIPSLTPTTQPPPPSQELPFTSQVLPTPPPSPIAQPQSPQQQPQHSQPSHDAKISMNLLYTLLETRTTLTRRVEHLEQDKIAQTLEITKVDTSEDSVMDDLSKQEDIIATMDADEDVILKDVAAVARKNDELEPAELKKVVEVVTTAKLMTEVVTAASATITTATTPITAATLTAAPSAARRRKGVVIRDPEKTATPSMIIHSEPKSKDKGKRIMIEEPKPLKKQAQIEQDEAYARELEAELNKNINWDEVIEQVQK
nr:hypothetical protein [Tanacetum cinerariifolium]